MALIDLTHPLSPDMPNIPYDPGFSQTAHSSLEREGYRLTLFSLGSHCGTHMDAPAHFLPDGPTLDQTPLERLVGPAQRLAIPKQPGQEITLEDLSPFEGLLHEGSRIVVDTGWAARWGQECYYGDSPYLGLGAARLLAERRVGLLGMDLPGLGPDLEEVHHLLLGRGTVLVENLTNLCALPQTFTLVVLPPLILGADGAPVRAIALTP